MPAIAAAVAGDGGGGGPGVSKGLVKVMVHPFQDIFTRECGVEEGEGGRWHGKCRGMKLEQDPEVGQNHSQSSNQGSPSTLKSV